MQSTRPIPLLLFPPPKTGCFPAPDGRVRISWGPHSKESCPWTLEAHRPLWKLTEPLSRPWLWLLQSSGNRFWVGQEDRVESRIWDEGADDDSREKRPCGEDPEQQARGRDASSEPVSGRRVRLILPRQSSDQGRRDREKVREPGRPEPALKKCGSVSRLSSCSPKRVLAAWLRRGKARKGHTGWGGAGKALGTRKSVGRMVSPGARDASVGQLLSQSSLGEGPAE